MQTSYAKYNTHTVMKSQLRIEWRTVSSHFIKSQLATEAKQRYNTIFCKINWWKMSVVLCICILKSKKALISHNTILSAWRLSCKGNRLKMKNKANNSQCSAPQTYMCSDSIVQQRHGNFTLFHHNTIWILLYCFHFFLEFLQG